jgi:AAA domain, putative AbiEii toxin, Type IV TA system
MPDHRLRMIERELPLERVSRDEWLDLEVGDRISLANIVTRYPGVLPGRLAKDEDEGAAAFREFVKLMPVHLIETQRLISGRVTARRGAGDPPPITVLRYAQDLAANLSRALAENSTTTQRLDRSFPRRVLASPPLAGVTDMQIRERYGEQSELRDRLAEIAVLDTATDVPLPDRELQDWERRMLWTYLDDAQQKLATFEPLLDRVALLRDIVNSRFRYKKLLIERDQGFKFVTDDNSEIGPTALSSGEQHELVLIYDLLFNVEPGSLVLIDEPEISLHVAWQQQFLDDMMRVSQLASLRFIVATHSPQIIHKWWSRAIDLSGDAESTRLQ